MIHMAHKDEKDVSGFLYCSSGLEERVFSLYRSLSDKVQNPLVKSLFLYIAYDSLKHSLTMRGIAETVSNTKPKPGDCEKKLKQIWEKVIAFSEEISKQEKVSDQELPAIARELTGFEDSLSEEYSVFVQLKTLEYMTKEVTQQYKVDLASLKNIFELIIKDKENHREILTSIEELFTSEETAKDNTPIVRYQHLDAW
jgi:rubrerythrin